MSPSQKKVEHWEGLTNLVESCLVKKHQDRYRSRHTQVNISYIIQTELLLSASVPPAKLHSLIAQSETCGDRDAFDLYWIDLDVIPGR